MAADMPVGYCTGMERSNEMLDFVLVILQMAMLILLSHLLHKVLCRLGQPSVVSHLIAGMFLGETGLGSIPFFMEYFNSNDVDHMTSVAALGRTFFMFLIGLEIDLPYLFRSFRSASAITLAGALACGLASAVAVVFGFLGLGISGNKLVTFLTIWILLANTASPVLIRMVTELKLGMSEVGRLAISSSLINDVACLLLVCLANLAQTNVEDATVSQKVAAAAIGVGVLALSVVGMRRMVTSLNGRNECARGISDGTIAVILLGVLVVSGITEILGYTGMMATFILGVAFPREGASWRTLLRRLTPIVNNLVLPVYFGFSGMQASAIQMSDKGMWLPTLKLVALGILAKVLGTIAAATRYLDMTVKEGFVLGLLLNVKGHIDLIVISLGRKYGLWDRPTYVALIFSVLINSITAGPAAAYVVSQERKAMPYRFMGLERLDLFSELRFLSCVYGPQELPTLLDLVEMAAGAEHAPASPYLMHLIEFTGSVTTNMLYNQIQDEDQEQDLGGDNARLVNTAVDAFVRDTRVKVRSLTTFSKFDSMHLDLCNTAHDLRALLIILPFHRRPRFDGKMGSDHEDVRTANNNVMHHAPCTVALLVDRGFGGLDLDDDRAPHEVSSSSSPSANPTLHHVVVLFFGGPDDREAVAFGLRLAMHPCVSVTVVRFLSAFNKGSGVYIRDHNSTEVLMDVMVNDDDDDDDDVYMSQFHSRFVSTGMVTYIERSVENSADTVTALSSMEGTYTLFVVGKERHGPTAKLTTGMSDWDECPELGSIGDLLASSDFMSSGSVLVIQQHRVKQRPGANNKPRTDHDDFDDDDHDEEEFAK